MKNETFSLRLEPSVHGAAIAMAESKGREPGDYVASLVIDGLLRAGAFDADPAEKAKLELREELLEQVVARARLVASRYEGAADIPEHITAIVCEEIAQDEEWKRNYETFIEAGAFEKKIQLKNRINPKIGSRIKSALRLHSKKKPDGKVQTVHVTNGIIQIATALSRHASKQEKAA